MSIVVMSVSSLGDLGFKTVGELPQGLPAFNGRRSACATCGVVPLAFACFLPARNRERVRGPRWRRRTGKRSIRGRNSLAWRRIRCRFGSGYPVAGGLSQSSVNDKAGAKTPLALVFASTTIALCLLFLTGLLRNLPTVVLAAIVLVAVKGLINVRGLRQLWYISRCEHGFSAVATAGSRKEGILREVMLAALVSVLLSLATARPHVAFLGRIPTRGATRPRAPPRQ
jgi:hypothetical protein